jgi:hypothetical protein
MKDRAVALGTLAQRAPFVSLTPEHEQRILELINEIRSIFDQQAKQKTS